MRLTIHPIILLLCFTFGLAKVLANPNSYDSYGGLKSIPLENKSGFFELQKVGKKHYLVTPEGHAFKSLGINHLDKVKVNIERAKKEITHLGFNSAGYEGIDWIQNTMPYTKGIHMLRTSNWQKEKYLAFEDVFNPKIEEKIKMKIKQTIEPHIHNKNLICYFLTDIPIWIKERFGKGWLKSIKALPEKAPGKQVWKKWKHENPNKDEKEFIPLIARHIYKVGISYIRELDPNHLVFSDRYSGYHFPRPVIDEIMPYVDGLAIQPRKPIDFERMEEMYKRYQKPIYIADFVSSYSTSEHQKTMGNVADNVEDYLDFYKSMIHKSFSLPFIIGFNKCQFIDEDRNGLLKQGLYKSNWEPNKKTPHISSIHKKALDIAYEID